MHEAASHPLNSFITLTYSDTFLPLNNTLSKRHLQLFFKRLRKSLPKTRIAYFAVGEYGDQTNRPHYHALVFNHDWPDKRQYKGDSTNPLFRSDILDKLWGMGLCSTGSVTYTTAAYCARYAIKKITGDLAKSHYQGREPEFMLCSTKPAIGLGWIQRYADEVYVDDNIIVNGKEHGVPAYYDKYLKKTKPELYEKIIDKRKEIAKSPDVKKNSTPERLAVRKEVFAARFSTSTKRTL